MDFWGVGLWALGFGVWDLGFAVYVAGVVWGLIAIDARPAARLGLALVWPLGPLAFVLTITILLAASLIAYPAFGAAVLAAAGAMWWAVT
ncbi:MAG: hypothetical protein HW418_3721 [Anaerolineales bacterium]|nr:hypothetical protein [Anaerolineales bacterium]